jgi:hypothetical protein
VEFHGKPCANLQLAELTLDGELPVEQRLTWGVPEVFLGDQQPDFRFEPKTLATLWKRGRFESLTEFCEAQKKLTAPAAAKADPSQPAQPSSYCTPRNVLAPTKPLTEPFLKVHDVEVGEDSPNSPRLLVMETTRGWYPANVAFDAGTYDDRAATIYSAQLSLLATREGRLWIAFTRRRADFFGYTGVEAYDAVAEFTFVCSLGERLYCHRAVTAFGETGPSWSNSVRLQETPRLPFHPQRWNWRRPVSVGPTGNLRFGRCLDANDQNVPCHVADMNHLLTE